MNTAQLIRRFWKKGCLYLLCLLFVQPIVAQKAMKTSVEIEKTSLPRKFLEPIVGTYGIKLILADNLMIPKHDEYVAQIDKAIKLPGYKRVDEQDSHPELMITIDMTAYKRETTKVLDSDGRYHYEIRIVLPTSVKWDFSSNPASSFNYVYPSTYGTDGSLTYKSPSYPQSVLDDPNRLTEIVGEAIDKGYLAYLDGFCKDLSNICANNYWPYVYPRTIILHTFESKSEQFPEVDDAVATAQRGLKMIAREDLLPNAEAMAVIDEAIAKYDAVLEKKLITKKTAVYYLLTDKSELEFIVGNLTAAEKTIQTIRELIPMFASEHTFERVIYERDAYKKMGIEHR